MLWNEEQESKLDVDPEIGFHFLTLRKMPCMQLDAYTLDGDSFLRLAYVWFVQLSAGPGFAITVMRRP